MGLKPDQVTTLPDPGRRPEGWSWWTSVTGSTRRWSRSLLDRDCRKTGCCRRGPGQPPLTTSMTAGPPRGYGWCRLLRVSATWRRPPNLRVPTGWAGVTGGSPRELSSDGGGAEATSRLRSGYVWTASPCSPPTRHRATSRQTVRRFNVTTRALWSHDGPSPTRKRCLRGGSRASPRSAPTPAPTSSRRTPA